MGSVLKVITYLATLWFSLCYCASTPPPVNVDDLDPLKECRRIKVQLFESGNKAYMYGGYSWVNNGTEAPFLVTNHYLRIVDLTSARDLGDPSILTAKEIPPNITIFEQGAFWVDGNKAYVVGGAVSAEPWLSRQGEFLRANYSYVTGSTILTYDIEAENWSAEPANQPERGAGVRSFFCCGSFAYDTPYGKAYFYSGHDGVGNRYRMYPDDDVIKVKPFGNSPTDVSSLLTFHEAGFRWSNVTPEVNPPALMTPGTVGGALVLLPGTEASTGGVAIQLGGSTWPNDNMLSLSKVLVYDASLDKWYGQATTAEGDNFPPGRRHFCTVAASAPDNSSHNIYMYGGESADTEPDAYSDIWILSIPAFRWIPVETESVPRRQHGCTKVADRYILTYGGMKSALGSPRDEGNYCDQENYGLRLFDMSNLVWTSRYDGPSPGPHAFKVPRPVYNVIGGNEQGAATQTAPDAGFEVSAISSLFKLSSSATTTTSPTPPSNEKSSNTGAIVGGVVGGLTGIGIFILGVFCLMRRRKGGKNAYDPPQAPVVEKTDKRFTQTESIQRELDAVEQEVRPEMEAQNRFPQELEASSTPSQSGHNIHSGLHRAI